MAAEESGEPKHLFEGVYFAVVPDTGIGEKQTHQLIKDLEDNGAVHTPLASSELGHITHLIANSSDFSAYHDAIDAYIHVVKSQWVEYSMFKKRAANPRQYRPDPLLFLSDVVVTFADDIPEGDQDAIIGGLLAMGGQYSPSLTKLTTHIIALSMDNQQCCTAVDKKLKCNIVLPHWFDICLKLGKKIHSQPYTLPDPPICHHSSERLQPKASSDSECNIQGASQLDPRLQPLASPSKQRKHLSVFRDRKILLGPDLSLAPHLLESITEIICQGGGKVTDNEEEADTLICHYRDRQMFRRALNNKWDIGNMNWLYHLINTGKWTTPTRRLLHFPIPKHGIQGFENYKISISNYTGEARVYLESLVKAAKGQFTKTMTQENTHLVTAHAMSEKVDAAKEWNINMVNHLWLEESYAQCKVQSLTNPKYTTFPSRTNLGEVIGQTGIDGALMTDMYANVPQKKHNNGSGALGLLEPNSSNAATPSASNKRPSSKHKHIQDPSSALEQPNGKENFTPGSNGRGAKDRALNKLHQMAPDIALYEKEAKRVGGVIYGGRRVTDPDRVDVQDRDRRHSSPRRPTSKGDTHKGNRKRSLVHSNVDRGLPSPSASVDEDEDAEDISTSANNPQKKRQKKAFSGLACRYVVTGGASFKWDAKESNCLKKLGMQELETVPENNKFDVLVAPKILRTANFFAAIAAGVPIVSPAWLEACRRKNEVVRPEGYEVEDHEGEGRYDFRLAEVMRRAVENREKGGLLKGWTVFCTEHVRGGPDSVMKIVAKNGGKCMLYRGRETKPPLKKDRDLVTLDGEPDDARAGRDEEEGRFDRQLFLVTAKQDKGVWPKFRSMAEAGQYKATVVQPEWLFQIALTQDLQCWDEAWLDVEQ